MRLLTPGGFPGEHGRRATNWRGRTTTPHGGRLFGQHGLEQLRNGLHVRSLVWEKLGKADAGQRDRVSRACGGPAPR